VTKAPGFVKTTPRRETEEKRGKKRKKKGKGGEKGDLRVDLGGIEGGFWESF